MNQQQLSGLVNSSAETDAWFVKIEMSDSNEVSSLMMESDYKEHCEKEAH
jgi:glycine cleavage system H protein